MINCYMTYLFFLYKMIIHEKVLFLRPTIERMSVLFTMNSLSCYYFLLCQFVCAFEK
jgi:hypothetical protein